MTCPLSITLEVEVDQINSLFGITTCSKTQFREKRV